MKSEHALQLAARIVELRCEVSRLKNAEEELRNLERKWVAVLCGEDSHYGATIRDGSMVHVILSVLESATGEALDAEQIAQRGLPGAKLASVRSALSRLFQMGRIERQDRGKYRIARVVDAESCIPLKGP